MSEQDQNREGIIEKINNIIKQHGDFTVADVEADSSPFVPTKGKLSYLMEDFYQGGGVVRVYDPTSHSSDEIDEYDEGFEVLETSQLEYVLDLAEKWAESNE